MRLKVKSVKYGVVKKPKTEKPSETKPAYLMQSRHNDSTEQFFNLAATPAYSSIQFCCGASCTVSFMCWSSFSRDRTSISAPSRGLIFIRSCSALRRDKSSGQQRTGSCSHGFISRCNSIILGVDGLFRCLGMSVYCMLLEWSVLTCPFLRSPSLLQAGEET